MTTNEMKQTLKAWQAWLKDADAIPGYTLAIEMSGALEQALIEKEELARVCKALCLSYRKPRSELNKMKQDHTPLPWVEGRDHRIESPTSGGACTIVCSEFSIGDYRDRKFILSACNSHYELLGALKNMVACLEDAELNADESGKEYSDVKLARRVIARVEKA
jgi:hypothetical protein